MSLAVVENTKPEFRKEPRKQVYQTDFLEVEIYDNNRTFSARVVDISQFGLSIFINGKNPSDLNLLLNCIIRFKKFDDLGLPVSCSIKNMSRLQFGSQNGTKIGLLVDQVVVHSSELSRTLGFKEIVFKPFFQLLAYADDPIFFSESLYFKIVGVWPNGLTCHLSGNGKSFLPGFKYRLVFSVPGRGEYSVLARMEAFTNIEEQAEVHARLSFQEASQEAKVALAEYSLLAAEGNSIASLRESGFPVSIVDGLVTVTHPSSRADWDELLQLRFSAYKAAGKFKDCTSPLEMIDNFDRFSRHIICKSGGKVVAAVRIVFVGTEFEKSEHHSLGITIPEAAKERGFIEISRACVNPDYRGSDILIQMLRKCLQIVYHSGIQYGVANCNPEMWPSYSKMGWKKFGMPFAAFGRDDCQVIWFDAKWAVETGLSGNPIVWNMISKSLSKSVLSRISIIRAAVLRMVLFVHYAFRKPIQRIIRKAFLKRPQVK